MSENEKKYTLKSVQSEMERTEKSKKKKQETVKKLNDEIRDDTAKIKELEIIYDRLYHEDLQRQIASVWFKEKKMTGAQITKFLEISKQIHDQIDVLDVSTIVQAVTHVYRERQAIGKQGLADETDEFADTEEITAKTEAEKVGTYTAFSSQTDDE